jgi:hypothetical protein
MRLTIIVSVLFIGLLLGHSAAFNLLTVEEITIKVTEKERIVEGSGKSTSSKYLVFTEDEVFENTDSIWFFKFSSSDLQGQLKEGEEYKVKVCGFRIPFLSSYRNIIEIQ